jgi:spore germination protein KB
MLLLCAYAIRSGLETTARAFEIASYFIIAFLIIVLPAITLNTDFKNITPFFENGVMPAIKASLQPIGWQGEVFLLAILMPHMKNPSSARKCAILAIFITAIILTANTVLPLARFGSTTVARMTFPTYEMIRTAYQFRLDALILIFWVLGLFGKIVLFYYAAVLGCAQIANLKDYRPVILPLGVIMAALSIYNVANVVNFAVFNSKIAPLYLIFYEYIIPSVIFVMALMKKLKN